jgi:hypothetical protein
MDFYVWSDRYHDFQLRPESDVICSECGAKSADMTLDQIDRVRGEWMLQCPCGEQFFTHND